MISTDDLKQLIKEGMPEEDTQVEVMDVTGERDHYRLWVCSRVFEGKNTLESHQLVYQALGTAMRDGRLHAVEITTEVPQN